jgi:gluconolactonase
LSDAKETPGLTENIDARFGDLIVPGAELRHLADGCIWAEGPVWMPDSSSLIWSDIPNNRMLSWSEASGASTFRQPSGYANGNTLDRAGRLVSCQHSPGIVTRTEPDGTITTLADTYQGNKLNSPNDLVVKSDGSIWFTDPPYGILSDREGHQRESEIGANYVYRLNPESGDLTVVADDFDRPNGIAFSPDEKTIYIADTGKPRHMRALDVNDDDTLSNSREFAKPDPPASDGFRVDAHGNVWTSAGDGVHVFAPDGTLLGKVPVPEKVANCEFGGADGRTLFITATTSLYSMDVAVTRAPRP